jgi:16S rRNA (guanine966-N2)-methyltransferase
MAASPRGPRIVAGELGGRRLHSPSGTEVRPSTERAREAIFSMLGPLRGESALDLFCGTGVLGIEALSRGASHLTLVDRDPGPAAENVELLGIGDRCTIVADDAIGFLRRVAGRFDIVLCDPPYRLADRLGTQLDTLLPARLNEGGRVIVESGMETPPLLTLPLLRERRYGRSLVRIHRLGDRSDG